MLESILLLISSFSLLIWIIYYVLIFRKLSIKKNNSNVKFNEPISIIVCAKNEVENLKFNLPKILEQNYINFEVIIVNDQSKDNTQKFLESETRKHPNLIIVEINNFVNHTKGKKFALTLGIKTAKHKHLLLTDADCVPNSKDWLKKMSSNFNEFDIILGYSPYKKESGLLNQLIRYDCYSVAQQYLSYALIGMTYMGVGRNLAYKKSLFFNNKGFASHIHIPSGDDDLFIQEIAENNKIGIEISKSSHTTSEVIKSWKDWFHQKRRHLTTSSMYQIKFKILLSIYPLVNLVFLMSIFILFFLNGDLNYIFILLIIKYITSYIINFNSMKKLDIYDLYWYHPIYEFLHIFIQLNFVLLNLFNKPKNWNR